jgi:hypothetical protein
MAKDFERTTQEYALARNELRNTKIRLLGDVVLGSLSVGAIGAGIAEIFNGNILIGLGLTVVGAASTGGIIGNTTDNFEFYTYAVEGEERARAAMQSSFLSEPKVQ